MAKNSKKKTNKRPPFSRYDIVVAVVCTIIFAVPVVYFGHQYYSNVRLDWADKERFEAAHKSVETLHGRLQQAAEPGQEWRMDASCSRASAKFEEGSIGCRMAVNTEVVVTHDTQAEALIAKYAAEFRQASDLFVYKGEGSPPSPITFPAGLKNGYDGAGYTERETNMVCGSLYSIDDRFKENKAKRTLEISFSCNDGARELHYPRNDI